MKKLLKTLILILTGLVAAVVIAAMRGLFSAQDTETALKALCDSFTVPAVVFICAGLLIFCANGGTFDMIGYGVKTLFSVLQTNEKMKQNKESFADYRARKRENDQPFGYLLLIGLGFFLVSIILVIVYLQLT